MAETPKRLKKNISFSEHELDIFEYLNRQKNASAFIKKLIRNQMIIDEGIVSVQVVTVEPKKEQVVHVPQKEIEPEVTESQVTEPEEISDNTAENESSITIEDGLQPLVEMKLSDEDLENQDLLPDL